MDNEYTMCNQFQGYTMRIRNILVTFFMIVTKCLASTLRKEGFLLTLSPLGGRRHGGWQKRELAGHTEPSVRKEKYQCSDHLVLRIPAEGVDSPHSACVSLLLLTVSCANRGILRALFPWQF